MDDGLSKWRTFAGDIPDAIAFKEPAIGPGGLPIEIRLKGKDLSELKLASTQLINWFYSYEGVSDLYDDLRPGKPEIQVKLKEGAKIRGFDARSVSKQLIPLACSIVFGLLMSTILVLLVVPCLYTILSDFNLVRIETEIPKVLSGL
ncbi:MAG: hypothetical protein KKE12_03815 [Proteobacteria bacterium]|nr:hypothetical protein [Pseudomonadota bacterium]